MINFNDMELIPSDIKGKHLLNHSQIIYASNFS